jgi:hypothetical protein
MRMKRSPRSVTVVTESPASWKVVPSKGAFTSPGPASRVMRCMGERSNASWIARWHVAHEALPA